MSRTLCALSMLVFSVLVLCGACVRSIEPVLKDEQVVIDKDLAGAWVDAKAKEGSVEVALPAADDKRHAYQVVYSEGDGKKGNFLVRLGKAGDVMLAEVSPADPAPGASDAYKAHLLPLHSFLIVHQTKPELVVTLMKADWIEKYVAAHPNELKVAKVGSDDMIVTASTEEWQAFILKHMKDVGAWGEKTTFIRAKRP